MYIIFIIIIIIVFVVVVVIIYIYDYYLFFVNGVVLAHVICGNANLIHNFHYVSLIQYFISKIFPFICFNVLFCVIIQNEEH